MRGLLKVLIFCWLAVCGVVSWVSVNIFMFLVLFSINAKHLTPLVTLMGLTSGVAMVTLAYKSTKFDLVDYIQSRLPQQ